MAREFDTESAEQDDPFRTIIEAEARANSEELDRLSDTLGEDEEDDSPDGTSRSGSTSSVETRKETPDETGSGGGRRPGIDKVLQDIDSRLGPDHASVVRSMVATANKSREAVRDLMDRIDLLEERIAGGGQQEEPTQEIDPALANLSPEDWRIFTAMASAAGYVRRDELESEDTIMSSNEYVNADLDNGIKAYGEQFGARDENGNFEFAPEVADKTREVWDRLHDPKRGLTGRDLFILAKHDDLVKQAANKRQVQSPDRRLEARRAITERHSAPRDTRSRMAYSKGKDDLETIIGRASISAMREQSR